ncbi:D-erythronate dehydrogenase (plasmid) [Thioclava sp. 'Guangxiensis']|uniref:D-erythronate dehydrogenase n=1 Tax=Thioclava sp. 'Guangxiensis' TaxID=3149044 RepID=UPI0032C3FC38
MHILIIGAAGMVGRKLTAKLLTTGHLGGTLIQRMDLVDVIPPHEPQSEIDIHCEAADLSTPHTAPALIARRPDVIFHLAAIVSGEAEADFDKGYRINLDGTRALFEAIRHTQSYCPRVVFASSIAVVGAPLPYPIPDDFHYTPLTSYGTQKAICELLLADYTRRGILDGVGLRLPTICIRPGAPNKAASGFFSGILREPLVGKDAVLPVPDTIRHWHASPRSAVGFMLHAASMDTAAIGPRRNLSMPGVSATVAEQIEALRRIAGDTAVKLIRRVPDPAITAMCEGWAPGFEASRARALGFRAESDFTQIIKAHIEDELEGVQ